MNIIKFLKFNAIRDLLSRKFLSIILIVISFLSIFSTLSVGNMLWSKFQDYKLAQFEEADSYVVAEFFLHNKEDIFDEVYVRDVLYSNLPNKPEKLEFCGFMNMIVEWNDEACVCNVQGNTSGLMELHKYLPISGKMFEELYTDYRKCIIKEGGRLYKKGIMTGDTVMINGEKFEVTGVVNYPMAYGDVFLSYAEFMELAGQQRHQYHAMLQYEDEIKMGKIRPYLKKSVEFLTECYTGIEHQEIFSSSVIKRGTERMLIAAMLVGFAAINFVVVIWEKIIFEKRGTGIRLAMGASFSMILTENIIKTEILIMLALVAAKIMCEFLADIPILGMHAVLPFRMIVCIWTGYSIIGALVEGMTSYLLIKRRNCLWLLKDAV